MKGKILRGSLIFALIFFSFYIFAGEISKLYLLRQENERIKMKTEVLEEKSRELTEKIEAIKNDQLYMEMLIREELGMIKESERIYRYEE